MNRNIVLFGVLAFVLTSCDQASPADRAAHLVTTKQFVVGLSAQREIGESCAAGGPDECRQGLLCLHTQPHPQEGWFCSAPCSSAAECPRGEAGVWTCAEFYPGKRACVPPPGWTDRAVAIGSAQ